ncbi:uncharacterized protein LOC144102802 [Amblyomma americanum]
MPALILFFKKAATDDHLLAAEAILEKLIDPSTKLYLEFLEYVLPFFANLNKETQSEETRIHLPHEKVSAMLKCILECYIKRDYLEATALSDVRYKDPAKFLPLEEIYLGAKATAALAGHTHGLNDNQVHIFRRRRRFTRVPPAVKFYEEPFVPCLPHSSAAIERVFSQVNLVKTKQRNRLSTQALCGLLHAKAKGALMDSCCYKFKITPSHLKRMNKDMYDD